MKIIIQRIYDHDPQPGYRVLVDRLWPRGVSKEKADLDDWWKDLAPSPALRTWFDHDPEKMAAFRKKYLHELQGQSEHAGALLRQVSKKTLVLLYGAKSETINHAVILKDYLDGL